MSRRIRLVELLVGVEGLALLRHLHEGAEEAAARRLADVRGLLDDESLWLGQDMLEAHPDRGYAARAASDDDPFDLVVCALALSHRPELEAAFAELERVLRPLGRLLVSVLHPLQVHLGWHARFTTARGERRFVREHPHAHADDLAAFRAAGVEVVDCREPVLRPRDVRAQRRVFANVPEAAVDAYAGLPAVLVWDLQKTRRAGPGS